MINWNCFCDHLSRVNISENRIARIAARIWQPVSNGVDPIKPSIFITSREQNHETPSKI